MMNLDRLLIRINAVLDGDAEGFEARALASEYAALGDSVRERMRQCVSLIKAGNVNAAFQVAETAPPVLDLAARLAFDRSVQWREYCRENRLPVPHKTEDSLVDQINSLYARGIDEAHPLYRDYRAAMRERDDLRALGVLNSIVRINSQDANARVEHDRLADKVRREFLRRLHEAKTHHLESDIIGILSEMEAAGVAPCPDKPEWVEASKVRDDWDRKRALGEAITLIPKIIGLRDAGEWEGAIPLLGRARTLEKQYGFHWPENEGHVIATTETWVAGHAAAVEKLRREEEQTEDLHRRLDEMEKRVADPKHKTVDKKFIEADIAVANEWIVEAESLPKTAHFGPHIHRAKRVRSKLEGILHQRRNRRLRLAIAASAALAILALVGYLRLQSGLVARDFQNDLARAESSDGVRTVLNFLAGPVRNHPDLAALDDNPARIEALRARAADADAALHRFSTEATAITKGAVSDAPFASLKARLEALNISVDSLPADLREEARGLAARAAEALAERGAREAANADTTIAAASDALGALLPPQDAEGAFTPDEAFAKTVQSLRDALFLSSSAKAETVALAKDRLARAESLLAGRDATLAATEALSRAVDLDTHLSAIAPLAALPVDNTAGAAARRVTGAADKLKALPLAMLPEGTLAMRRAAEALGGSTTFVPAEPTAVEVAAAGKLAVPSRFSGAWRAVRTKYFADGGEASSLVYLKDRPVTETSPLSGGVETRVKADVFKADGTLEKVALSLRSFEGRTPDGETLRDAVASKEGELIAELSRFYDSDRAAFNESPMEMLDRVNASGASPLLKAWAHLEILKIAAERPDAWGMPLVPEVARDAAELNALLTAPLRPELWLSPDRYADLTRKLAAFYAVKRPAYLPLARARLALVTGVLEAGAVYAGRVDGAGVATLTDKNLKAGDRLFGLDADGKTAVLGEADANGVVVFARRPAPYGPLLRLAKPPVAASDLDLFLPRP